MEKFLVFGTIKFPLPLHVETVDQAKTVAQSMVPGLAEAEGYVADNGDFVFQKKVGTKGL